MAPNFLIVCTQPARVVSVPLFANLNSPQVWVLYIILSFEFCWILLRNDEECDATDDASSTVAGYKNQYIPNGAKIARRGLILNVLCIEWELYIRFLCYVNAARHCLYNSKMASNTFREGASLYPSIRRLYLLAGFLFWNGRLWRLGYSGTNTKAKWNSI